MSKKNAPGREAEGASVCLLGGDIEAYSTARIRAQFLARAGLPFHRAALIAPLCFGEAANV